mmetsp:Transcript_24651/g.36553  ORF Transcript_24651/g.36553 Transcript_24651/m.36553 type:complete len:868 (-) Transcript_24651:123-2726(-)
MGPICPPSSPALEPLRISFTRQIPRRRDAPIKRAASLCLLVVTALPAVYSLALTGRSLGRRDTFGRLSRRRIQRGSLTARNGLPNRYHCSSAGSTSSLGMVMSIPETTPSPSQSSSSSSSSGEIPESNSDKEQLSFPSARTQNSQKDNKQHKKPYKQGRKRKYIRKREKTKYEKERDKMRMKRQAEYEQVRNTTSAPSLWSFEALFPAPVWDEETRHRDLYEVNERDSETYKRQMKKAGALKSDITVPSMKQPMKRIFDEPRLSNDTVSVTSVKNDSNNTVAANATQPMVDRALSRMVEDRMYGFRRSQAGDFQYDTSLLSDGAVQFRDGVRLGNPLKVNADRLNYHAKRELSRGHIEEAQELYERAIAIDPRDGRAYLGLSRVAQRRRDFVTAKEYLKAGIANSIKPSDSLTNGSSAGIESGGNPYLLQAMGCLEERLGHLAEAEAMFISAVRSRPCHAAAWVSLAQLRTRKLRQGANSGRMCYQTAERELRLSGLPQSSHVYTAWASMEYKKAGEHRRARELFRKALECDPRCSAAWLQLGVMESDLQNWDKAQECFEEVLTYDKRNSRVLQAYAIMESKRPDGYSREVIDLFERALKANPRDGGVLQAYALYVAKLGDIGAARNLLRGGTEVSKRHAPLWQAWGVLETRHGTPENARDVFQQGIWACAQSSGGQSGGRRCARLWQAWGVLEAREGDYSAARRCFSRALDADNRNVPAITAWTKMEEEIGNHADARSIFERALKQFPASSDDKMTVWRAYEVMEERAGNLKEAQLIFNRSMRETMNANNDVLAEKPDEKLEPPPSVEKVLKRNNEVEVSSWRTTGEEFGGEVWMNQGSIEGKVPPATMKKKNSESSSRSKKGDNV